ncbi:hypothetical protein LC605_25485 [Nostoc sp. CHAB 5836]|uniref:hypothetical protein n=1 Tax=Nostoc sp. CHAB 5836 TaxID=2780404 RepID=UPI001E656164|nr:hypothetical protein [Nostoc sp. CHAB 5836]MCC5618375.1 hypothetical protein [Nostoc sp. CHAB 5836]
MSESTPNKNSKSCILTKDGRKNLNDALNKKYKSLNINKSQLHKDIGEYQISYDTVCKILDKPTERVTRKYLDILFNFLKIDLKESDYETPEKKPHSITQETNSSSETPIQRLKAALEDLNYEYQKRLFKDAIGQLKPTATFLIHGKHDYGQQWLVNLLRYQHLPLHTTDVWQHPLKINRRDANIENIWRKLAELLGTPNSAPEILAEELYKHWESRPVILVLYIEHIADRYLEQFINDFWKRLVDMVNTAYSSSPNNNKINRNNRLVLFLVDNANSQAKLQKYLLINPEKTESYKPLVLQIIEHFNPDWIQDWVGIQSHYQLFSELWKVSEFRSEELRKIGLNYSTPVSVFREICNCCELDWQDIETKLSL